MLLFVLLLAASATAGVAGTRLAAVAAPPLPSGSGPPPVGTSYIDLQMALPLKSVRAGLERALPIELRRSTEVDTAIADARDAESEVGEREEERESEREWKGRPVRWRGLLRRQPFVVAARADSLTVTAGLAWSVEPLERGLEGARCGSAEDPFGGSVGCASLLGWSDEWSLETRSRVLPTRLAKRCRPNPPGLDFTHRVNARVEARLLSLLPARVDSVVRATTDLSGPIRAALKRFAQPVMIGDSAAWLRWDVRGTRVDPPRGAGDSILVHVTFEAIPSIVPGPESAAAVLPLSAPSVRLSGHGIRVPFDCWVEFADIERDIATLPAGRTDRDTSMELRITGVRVTGGGDRMAIAVELDGPVTGTAWLVGTLAVQTPRHVLECPDLDWSPESRRALQNAAGAARWPALRAALEVLAGAVRRRVARPLDDCVAAWEKGIQDALQPTTQLPTLQGGVHQRQVAGLFCTDHAIGVRMLVLGQAQVIPERLPPSR